MDDRIRARDIEEFSAYLRSLTDAQVRGVYEKEKSAGREAFAQLAILEAQRRNMTID